MGTSKEGAFSGNIIFFKNQLYGINSLRIFQYFSQVEVQRKRINKLKCYCFYQDAIQLSLVKMQYWLLRSKNTISANDNVIPQKSITQNLSEH